MAWGVGTAGSSSVNDSTAATSYSPWAGLSTGIGDLILLVVATDNVQTTDGVTNLHTSVVTTASEVTWTKLSEFTNGQTGAGLGATVSLWISSPCPDTSVGLTTVNFASSITKKAMCWIGVSLPSGSTWQKAGTDQTRADDGIDPGSMTLGSLTSGEYLWVRGIAAETNADTAITASSGWTPFGGGANASTTGGAAAANMAVAAEYDIATATTLTSDPTWTAADCASVLVALKELASTPISGSDAGSGSDTAAVTAVDVPVSETATGSDVSGGLARPISEAAAAVDAAVLTVPISTSDTAAGADVSATSAAFPLSDAAAGVDTSQVTATGVGTRVIVVMAGA